MKHRPLTQFISTFLIAIFLFSTSVPLAGAGDVVYFYHNDHLGSPLAMTDTADPPNVVWRRDYKPFGEEIELQTDTPNTHSYTGKEFDAETGLYYYGARYYDPTIGRFISVDPVGGKPQNPQTWNRYAYTLNNPYKYVDPDGRDPKAVADAIRFGTPMLAIPMPVVQITGGLLILGGLGIAVWESRDSIGELISNEATGESGGDEPGSSLETSTGTSDPAVTDINIYKKKRNKRGKISPRQEEVIHDENKRPSTKDPHEARRPGYSEKKDENMKYPPKKFGGNRNQPKKRKKK